MAGLLTFTSNAQLDAADAAKQAQADALERQNAPVVLGLAAHVRACWDAARDAKQPIETKMLKALRQRTGEYDETKLTEIREYGGSEIFMMLTETKCRGAESWLRDILLDEGAVPFGLKPTPIPDMPPDMQEEVSKSIATSVIEAIQNNAFDAEMMSAMREQAEMDVRRKLMEEAADRSESMEKLIQDQFFEGGMLDAFDSFLSDLSTYPFAVMKGPVVRRMKQLDWAMVDGKYKPEVTEKLAPTYARVDPFRFYWEPGLTRLQDGYTIEHHKLARPELSDLIGVPGYDDEAIKQVLANMPNMSSWLWSAEHAKAELESKYNLWRKPTPEVDAIEFWGRVSGLMLLEWGMDPANVPDPTKEYDANVWLIGSWVIKATLNFDPLGGKPYRMTSFFKRPGSIIGAGVPEVIEDVQAMCNGAARALANNMGLASGPQVEINTDRLAPGEKITTLRPWKQWQTVTDPLGSGQPAIKFNQPEDRSQSLLAVYAQFARMADEQSGIPAYVYGDGNVGGAGRTASGLSMLMGSAGKGIRQVIMHIDFDVIGTVVTAQYNWNMRYVEDESVKGDCEVIPRGAVTLANREQLNVRRVEFLQATANPIDAEIVGVKGRAAILREVSKGLSMPVDNIVPSDEQLDIQAELKRQALEAQQQAEINMARQSQTKEVKIQRGPGGTTMKVGPSGDPMGGKESNTVSNSLTGRAA